MSALIPVLQQLTATISTLVQTLQAQLVPAGGPAAAGAAEAGAAIAGGGPADGCCGGAMGAAAGADALGATDSGIVGGSAGAPEQGEPSGSAPAPAPAAAPAGAQGGGKGAEAVAFAKQFLGKPYVYAKAGPDSFDCSGLTKYVMEHFGIKLPHRAAEQAKMGTAVDKKDLQPGDLVFFANSSKGVHHVGMYVGDGNFIHAPKTGDVVKISSMNSSYYTKEFSGARRFL